MKDKQTEPPKAGEHVGEIGRGAQVPKVQPQVQPYQLASSPVSCTLARRGRGVLGEQGISTYRVKSPHSTHTPLMVCS